MSAGQYDITIEQGATWQRNIVWKDSTGTPIDITGYSARMQIRTRKSSTSTLLSIDQDDYISVGTTDGLLEISIPASVTAALDFRGAVYDIEIESPSGTVYRLLEGTAELSKEVTR